jgi:predicted GNAT family N-acyltransferase
MKLVIRQGKQAFDDAMALRQEVFVDEQGFVDEFDAFDAIAYHVTLYKEAVCVGVGRVYQDSDGSFHLGRIAIKKEERHKGYGRIIMDELEQLARRQGAKKLALSSQVQALKFYERCGYQAVGPRHMEQHCPHQNMIKLLD